MMVKQTAFLQPIVSFVSLVLLMDGKYNPGVVSITEGLIGRWQKNNNKKRVTETMFPSYHPEKLGKAISRGLVLGEEMMTEFKRRSFERGKSL